MTISTTDRLVIYQGNGATTEFPFNFLIPTDTLSVSIQDWETKELSLLAPGSYSVTGLDNPSGGTVTYDPEEGALPATSGLVIMRTVPMVQALDIPLYGAFSAPVIEAQLDRIVMQIQQVAEQQSRSLMVGPGADVPDLAVIEDVGEYAAAAEAAANSVAIKYVANEAALAGLDPDFSNMALQADSMNGFDWRNIDSTAAHELDPNQHVVRQGTDKPFATGAWYRRMKGDRPCVRDDFGARGDNSTLNDQALYDAINWMEFYPSRSRVLSWPPGLFCIENILEIPHENTHLGVCFVGASMWDTNIKKMGANSNPVIRNYSQEFKMFRMALLTNQTNSYNWTNNVHGLVNDKGVDETADVDVTLKECRFQGFNSGVYHKGRGLSAHGNHFSVNRYGIQLDFYDTSDYTGWNDDDPDNFAFTDEGAFRGIMVSNTRFHSHDYAAIANIRNNAHKLNGLSVSNLLMDIGRRIFYGHLGREAKIDGCQSTNSRTACLELTGGKNFTISNCIFAGGDRSVPESTSANLIQLKDGTPTFSDPYHSVTNTDGTTGLFEGGSFSNITLAKCEQDAILDESAQLKGVSFENIKASEIGYADTAGSDVITFASTNSTVRIAGILLSGPDTIRSVVRSNSSTNKFISSDVDTFENTTPHYSGGSSAALLAMRTDEAMYYTPTANLSGATNTTSATPGELTWWYVGPTTIEVNGPVDVVAGAAGAVEFRIPMPVASNFSSQIQARGVFICNTSGVEIAGSVIADATNDQMLVRFNADGTSSRSFTLNAVYELK